MVTVREIAAWVGGECLGDGDRPIRAARPLTDAGDGDVTFVEGDKHLAAWHASTASAAIVGRSVEVNGKPIVRVADPLMAFAEIVQRFRPARTAVPSPCIHPTAVIDPTATIGVGSIVGPHAVVEAGATIGDSCHLMAGAFLGEGARIGREVVLHPHVVVGFDCVVGDRVVIHANAVIGADGFGYRTVGGVHVKVPQLGHVEIGDDCEIGAGTTIDRGTFGATVVGRGTKIDNQVQIGHNCRIGQHNILVSQVGIAGSTSTGDYVVMAGQVGVADHVHIGAGTVIGAKSGISKDVPPKSRMFGSPATNDREQMRIIACLQKLPDFRKDVKRILDHLGLKDAG
jgi:UDP-3-O-[3-hydroxymyristoyl] glucosamine N-acyltransferase